jgi:hypothetical protein
MLRLEGHDDTALLGSKQIEQAIYDMGEPEGPTYIMLRNEDGGYAQAGGFKDRYRIELREVYGEGFRHWLAASPTRKDRSDVVIYYRNHCTIHGKRSCPLEAWGENVLTLADALAILLFYQATGERLGDYRWEDVSEYFLKDESGHVKQIKPKK